jgi:hypothetical protein
MIVVNAPDFVSFSDVDLLRVVTTGGQRPNLLVDCTNGASEEVIEQLRVLCGPPVHRCRVPGPLDLPAGGYGTLLVDDVASLTIRQQVELSDWIQRQRGTIQVISIALQPIGPLVREGRFLEGLFYRLNTVSISAKGYRS